MTSTSNRSSSGVSVWCYDRNEPGEIVQESALGLSYAPVVSTASGSRVIYCGENLKHCCNFVVDFTNTMKEMGTYTEEDIVSFRNAWFLHTDRETQRPVFGEGLVQAKKDGTTADFIAQIQHVLQLR